MTPTPIHIMELRLQTPAKINLGLWVLHRRPDGYHDLLTVFQMVSLWDEVVLEDTDGEITLRVEGWESVPSGPDNLVWKAADLLRRRAQVQRGVRILLRKEIPVAAGLGGGSSDAAAVLMGLDRLWGLGIDRETLAHWAIELGTDVPFFVRGWPTALAWSRGDEMCPLRWENPGWLVLINPGYPVSTAWAYQQVVPRADRKEGSAPPSSPETLSFQLTGPVPHIIIQPPSGLILEGDHLRLEPVNDLALGVLGAHPDLVEGLEGLRRLGARWAWMTGSGPSLVGWFETETEALRARDACCRKGWRGWVVQPLDHPPY